MLMKLQILKENTNVLKKYLDRLFYRSSEYDFVELKIRFEKIKYFESILGVLCDGSWLVFLFDDELKNV